MNAGGFGGSGGGFSSGGFTMEDIFSNFGDIFGGHFGAISVASGVATVAVVLGSIGARICG